MGMPRCLLLVESVHHGNTATVARAIADELGADVAVPEAVPYTSLAGYSLIGFGSGVYYGQMHPALLDWVRGLPDTPVKNNPAFIFSTSGLPFLAKLWTASLRRLLAQKGFDIRGEFACRGFDTWGPLGLTGGIHKNHPDERDLEHARQFAAGIARNVQPGETVARCA